MIEASIVIHGYPVLKNKEKCCPEEAAGSSYKSTVSCISYLH
jgi:hypothetical protein